MRSSSRFGFANMVTVLVLAVLLGCEADDSTPAGMAYVPEGMFWMGCNAEEDEVCAKFYDENTTARFYHEVWLDSYYIDRTEVTMAEFQECVAAGVCSHHMDDGNCRYYVLDGNLLVNGPALNEFRGDNQPMVCVDWHQAVQYCEWQGKRLPTEAEWEKAARGTDGQPYPWGYEFPTCDLAALTIGGECELEYTSEVCSKSPEGDSPYGLCDMAGNVWEWVYDWSDSDYYRTGENVNPTGPEKGENKVYRGSSLEFLPAVGVLEARLGRPPEYANLYRGFRCVLPVE